MPHRVQESLTPGFMSNEGEVRINLNAEDFQVLVEGGELIKLVRGRNGAERNVRLIVSDIGYTQMLQAIRTAMGAKK